MNTPAVPMHRLKGQEIGPLEIRTWMTQRQCLTYIALFVGTALLCLVPPLFLQRSHTFLDVMVGCLRAGIFLTMAGQQIKNLCRIQREGPIEIITPNFNATPAQRRFNRQFHLITVLAVLSFMAVISFTILCLPWNLFAYIAMFVGGFAGFGAFIAYGRKTRKRLMKEAEEIVAQSSAKDGISLANSQSSPTPQTTSRQWWTESGLREEVLHSQQVNK